MSDLRDELVKAITEVYLKAPAVPKVTDVADAVFEIVVRQHEESFHDGWWSASAIFDEQPEDVWEPEVAKRVREAIGGRGYDEGYVEGAETERRLLRQRAAFDELREIEEALDGEA